MANLVTTFTNIIDVFSPKNVNSRSHSHLYNLKEQLADEVEIESYNYQFVDSTELEKKKEDVVTIKSKKAKPIYLRFWFWLITGLGSGSILAGFVWYSVEKSLPDISQIMNYARSNTVTIKAGDGTIIQQLGENNYETVNINQVPKTLINAFIVAEDQSFYKHDGVDFKEILNTGLNRLQFKKNVAGSSSITQQLGRLIFTDKKGYKILRPLREIRIAQNINKKFTKEQILEKYLNMIYLGSKAYGIADGARVYFNKSINELTLGEMATLAGVVSAPGKYSPLNNKENAKKRRDLILQKMQTAGYITKKEAQKAINSPLITNATQPKRLQREAAYFTQYIQQEINKYVRKEKLLEGGLVVETTLNLNWQKIGENVIKSTVEETGKELNFTQGSLVAIEPQTGEIKAMIGGKDFYENEFNRVTQAKRQPGSTFKAVVYSTAIAAGFSPNKKYADEPFIVDGYEPKNFHEDKYNGMVPIRQAVTNSLNIIAVKVLIDVGYEPIIEVAKKMGIESKLKPTYSLALGSSEVTLLELTNAYSTLANNGIHIKGYGIKRILDKKGKVIYENKKKEIKALGADTAEIMTWMLRLVVNQGTGKEAKLPDRQVAGKTGTTDDFRDLWFIGYIPQMVTGVWLGNDNNESTKAESLVAAGTWRKFMVEVSKDIPVVDFPPPPPDLSKLENRQPEIKIKSIKPKNIVSKSLDNQDNDDDLKDSNSDDIRNQKDRQKQMKIKR